MDRTTRGPILFTARRRRRFAVSLLTVAMAMLTAAAVVLAAVPVKKGATYRGTFKAGADLPRLSFKVSPNGKTVTNISTTDTGLYCPGGGAVTPVHFKNAAISAKGTFTTTGQYRITFGPRKGQIGEHLTLTGTFKKGGKESGRMTTTFLAPVPTACSGTSPYTTSAS